MTSAHKTDTTKNELDSISRMLFSSIASWLSDGDLQSIYLEGTDLQINALKSVMFATKDFQNELYNPNANLKILLEKLKIKSKAAETFEKELGTPWLL